MARTSGNRRRCSCGAARKNSATCYESCLSGWSTRPPELLELADAVAIVVALHNEYVGRSDNTNDALKSLTASIPRESTLERPQVFLAFPSQSDDRVVGIIQTVLKEFQEHFDVVPWTKMSDSGDINTQILKSLESSKFGICYFSERVGGSAPAEFQDNANVVFEAGVLHALTNNPVEQPPGVDPDPRVVAKHAFRFRQSTHRRLEVGSRLGHYDVTALIGEGGMDI